MAEDKKAILNEATYVPNSVSNVVYTTCGHLGPNSATLEFWGRVINFKIPDRVYEEKNQQLGTPLKVDNHTCPKCKFDSWKTKAIRCAVCSQSILPGDDVALYADSSPGANLEIAHHVGNNVIGCVRQGCGFAGALSGRWTEDGYSPIEWGEGGSLYVISSPRNGSTGYKVKKVY